MKRYVDFSLSERKHEFHGWVNEKNLEQETKLTTAYFRSTDKIN